MIKLGTRVKDSISGFSGTAMSRTEHFNGCISIGVQGPIKDGKIPEYVYIDEQQLDPFSEARLGGPMQTPPSPSHGPGRDEAT